MELSLNDAMAYLGPRLTNEAHEYFGCLWLNKDAELIKDQIINTGGTERVAVDVGYVVSQARESGAVGVILYHNHPSSNPRPSHEDMETTLILKFALLMAGVLVVDHIIIGGEHAFSFDKNGLL